MSFGSELWDQVKPIEEFTSLGISGMLTLNEMLKGFAAAEFDYGKALQKTSKTAREELKKNADKLGKEKSTTFAAFNDGYGHF